MNMLEQVLLMAGALIATLLLIVGFRRFALTHDMIDVPISRSSHHELTPRGGGIALVLVILVTLGVLLWRDEISLQVFLALGGAGLVVAVAGFFDDFGHVAASWRLLWHFLGAAWGLYWLGGLPAIVLWQEPVHLGLPGALLATVLLVWATNLYNFMDGINGIATVELITVALGGLVVGAVAEVWEASFLLAILISSGLGMLAWNFPRARVFIGDGCSYFLGLTLGLIAIWQASLAGELLVAWTILMGTFVVDATLTLMRRIIRRERFYEAHRSHAYQFASRHYASHTPVSLGVGVINLVWLLPWAVLVATGAVPALLGLVMAWVPLIGLAFWFRAGAAED